MTDTFSNDVALDPAAFRTTSDIINHTRKYTLEDFCQHFDYTIPSFDLPDGWQWAKGQFERLKSLYIPFLPKYARAADQKQRVLGDFRHPQKAEKALSHRHLDPQFKFGAVKALDGDCDFEWYAGNFRSKGQAIGNNTRLEAQAKGRR
jgi:hypothetical protein